MKKLKLFSIISLVISLFLFILQIVEVTSWNLPLRITFIEVTASESIDVILQMYNFFMPFLLFGIAGLSIGIYKGRT